MNNFIFFRLSLWLELVEVQQPGNNILVHYFVVCLNLFGCSVSTCVFNLYQCSLAAGRLTSGLLSITWIVSGGAFAQVIVLLWILLKYRWVLLWYNCTSFIEPAVLIQGSNLKLPLYLQLLVYTVWFYRVTSGVLGTIYPLLMAAIWGIGDGVFNTQINALIGILFKNDTVIIYSIYWSLCWCDFLWSPNNINRCNCKNFNLCDINHASHSLNEGTIFFYES